MDAQPPGERQAGVRRELRALAGLGLRPFELDLRDHYGASPAEIRRALTRAPALWVRGGNVFVLRHALARSGADRVLPALIRDDAIVYAGYSAGPCVLSPDLRGLDRCDDPAEAPAPPIWTGLGVLDRPFIPHVDSPDHPESPVLTALAAEHRARGVPVHALRDGQALVVEGATARVW
ncbi:peptidase [Bailinhaonella thermotolerans]|uniref:Peptidase n=2 Tax=Bailinhaonella thermotolerans TaxID=1070861 RepID=A0A3A4AYV8_9ACTN|nr:peptidase [Bailinhaonella thermotolerans]